MTQEIDYKYFDIQYGTALVSHSNTDIKAQPTLVGVGDIGQITQLTDRKHSRGTTQRTWTNVNTRTSETHS